MIDLKAIFNSDSVFAFFWLDSQSKGQPNSELLWLILMYEQGLSILLGPQTYNIMYWMGGGGLIS